MLLVDILLGTVKIVFSYFSIPCYHIYFCLDKSLIVGKHALCGLNLVRSRMSQSDHGSLLCLWRKLLVVLFAVMSRISLGLSQICFGSLDCKSTAVLS